MISGNIYVVHVNDFQMVCQCSHNSIRNPSKVPDNKVHGIHMGPIWGRQDPGGPHIGPMNFAIWGLTG